MAPRIEGLDADLLQSAHLGADGWTESLGLVYDLFSPERVEAHLDVTPDHHQPYGIVHGGVYCTIVETVGSISAAVNVMADGNVVVGVSNTTDFLRPVREGRIDVVATPVQRGRLQHLWEVRMTRGSDGKDVARGQLRLQVLPAERLGLTPPDAPGDETEDHA